MVACQNHTERAHFTADGRTKPHWHSKAAAKRAAKRIPGVKLDVYRCPVCREFTIGKPPKGVAA